MESGSSRDVVHQPRFTISYKISKLVLYQLILNLATVDVQVLNILFADDDTNITRSAQDNQMILNRCDEFYKWSRTLQVQAPKCRSLAYKEFNKSDKSDPFKPYHPLTYSSYDPKLSISGKQIPFMGSEPVKYLGRMIQEDLKHSVAQEKIREILQNCLEMLDKAPVSVSIKLWVYHHFVTAKLNWQLMIHDL